VDHPQRLKAKEVMAGMAKIETKVEIQAPVEKVFDFVADIAENHSKFLLFVEKVEATSDLKRGVGATVRYEAKSGGVKSWFENKVTNQIDNELIEFESIAGMKNKGLWSFAPTEKGTELTVVFDYELPASYLGKMLDKLFVERQNRKDVSESLKKLKAILEG
jgi:uncharacterized membrane protein